MPQAPKRRRLNVLGRSARTKRIFRRLSEGWSYEEIGREEHISDERVRQIVNEVLGNRVIVAGADHAHLQLVRLMPALRLAGQAVARGELKAIASLIKVIDRLDRHQVTIVAKYGYGEDARQRLLDKLNRIAANLDASKETSPPPAPDAAGGDPTPTFEPEPEPRTFARNW